MPDTPSITLVKTFTYRDLPEEWSNTYHFNGATPSTAAEWKALALAIHATERTCFGPQSSLVKSYGYVAGNEHSVAQIDHSLDPLAGRQGSLTGGAGDAPIAGDQAGWLRAKIGTSTRGKSVYVRKYFHNGLSKSGDPDECAPNWITNMVAHANGMLAGGLPGGATWCGPQGQTASLPSASRYITTRTLKRRGKRPTTP